MLIRVSLIVFESFFEVAAGSVHSADCLIELRSIGIYLENLLVDRDGFVPTFAHGELHGQQLAPNDVLRVQFGHHLENGDSLFRLLLQDVVKRFDHKLNALGKFEDIPHRILERDLSFIRPICIETHVEYLKPREREGRVHGHRQVQIRRRLPPVLFLRQVHCRQGEVLDGFDRGRHRLRHRKVLHVREIVIWHLEIFFELQRDRIRKVEYVFSAVNLLRRQPPRLRIVERSCHQILARWQCSPQCRPAQWPWRGRSHNRWLSIPARHQPMLSSCKSPSNRRWGLQYWRYPPLWQNRRFPRKLGRRACKRIPLIPKGGCRSLHRIPRRPDPGQRDGAFVKAGR